MFFSWRQKTSRFEYHISKVKNRYCVWPQDNKKKTKLWLTSVLPTTPSATCTVPLAGGSFPATLSHPCSSGKYAHTRWKSSTVSPWTHSNSISSSGCSPETGPRGTEPSMKPGSRTRARHQEGLLRGLCRKPWMSKSPVLPTHGSEARITTDITPTTDLQLMDNSNAVMRAAAQASLWYRACPPCWLSQMKAALPSVPQEDAPWLSSSFHHWAKPTLSIQGTGTSLGLCRAQCRARWDGLYHTTARAPALGQGTVWTKGPLSPGWAPLGWSLNSALQEGLCSILPHPQPQFSIGNPDTG